MQQRFEPHPDVVAVWDEKPHPPATEAQLAAVEAALGAVLPAAYREFLATYGTPSFSWYDYNFAMTAVDGEQTLVGQNLLASLMKVDQLASAHKIMTTAVASEEDLPKYPAHYLGIGSNPGQDAILLDLRDGAVKFWYFDEWPWGKEGNTLIWDVADSFYDFINGLRRSD